MKSPKASEPTITQLVREAQAVIDFEEDPHRAALQDNPALVKVPAATWVAVFCIAISFGPPLGLGLVTVASVAEQITTELGDPAKVTWVLGGFSLASAVSYSIAGPLSDVFGRRNPILFGQAFTVLGCIVAGAGNSVPTLIAGQTMIGFATGFLFVAYAGVPEMLPNKWRALGMGIVEAGIAFPWGTIAVLLGNILQHYATWRWIYYMGIIIETVSMAGTAWTYWPVNRPRGDYDKTRWQQIKEFDLVGLVLFASGWTAFLIGITWAGTAEHPWNSAGVIAPIIIGGLTLVATIVYDANIPPRPVYSWALLRQFKHYSSSLVVIFITGMNFYAMSSLIPRGFFFLFTTKPVEIGLMALPVTIMETITAVVFPVFSHKLGRLKNLLVIACVMQFIFMTASVAAVYPNRYWSFVFIPAFGFTMFPWITILTYAIASLHVPHSILGLAMGIMGSTRAAGGAVGNAVYTTILNDRFRSYVGDEVAAAALSHGLNAQDLPEIIPAAIQYNVGSRTALQGIQGINTAAEEALQAAIRSAYGHAYRSIFYITIPFAILAIICAFFVEDPTQYMTNHVQFAMNRNFTTRKGFGVADEGMVDGGKAEEGHDHVEKAAVSGDVPLQETVVALPKAEARH